MRRLAGPVSTAKSQILAKSVMIGFDLVVSGLGLGLAVDWGISCSLGFGFELAIGLLLSKKGSPVGEHPTGAN